MCFMWILEWRRCLGLRCAAQTAHTHRLYADGGRIRCQVEVIVREGQTQQCTDVGLHHSYISRRIHFHIDFRAETGD